MNDVRIPILMWHKVDDHAPSRHWVTAAQFERQMAALVTEGHTPIPLRALYELKAGERDTLPPKPVVLTFDDGYQNFYTHAFPLLRRLGFPVVMFIPTGMIGETTRRDNAWDPGEGPFVARHLIWREIEEMAETGLVEFHSHSVTHPNLEQPGADIAWELRESRNTLAAHVPTPIDFFSYPFGFGAENRALHEQLRDAGYKAAVGGWSDRIEPLATADLWALQRLEVTSFHDTPVGSSRLFLQLLDPGATHVY